MAPAAPHPFPTVDVPDHAHYTIGSVILAIGITGMVGNFLVIYAFCRSDNFLWSDLATPTGFDAAFRTQQKVINTNYNLETN